VLVIAARKGEFETGFDRGGQTREHAQLAKVLGVSKLIVVVNKMDDPTVKWSKERWDEINTKINPFLKSCGYNVAKDVTYVPISGLYGTNMKTKVTADVCPWYEGKSFFDTLDDLDPLDRNPDAPFRLPVLDKHKDMGTIVMGKTEAGTVRRGDKLVVMPNNVHVKVTNVYRDDIECSKVAPGENVRMRLAGIEEDAIMTGFVLCAPSAPVHVTQEIECQLAILELLEHKSIFTAGYKAIIHIHAVTEECEVTKIVNEIDGKTRKPKEKKKGQALFLKGGSLATVRIRTSGIICCEKFADVPQLGRFTLRDEGKTIAIGKVLKLKPYEGANQA
jgi:peptide chain release factor subunit 3